MPFKKNDCIIRKTYCGTGKLPQDHYRKGTPNECLRKGYGAADWNTKKKNQSPNSLQQIHYIGGTFDARFKRFKIYTQKSLLTRMQSLSAPEKRILLKKVLVKKDGVVDQRAFNSVVLFLHSHKIKNLPSCSVYYE